MRYRHEQFWTANVCPGLFSFRTPCVSSFLFGSHLFFSVGMLVLARRLVGAHRFEFPNPVSAGFVLIGLTCLPLCVEKRLPSRRAAKLSQAMIAAGVICTAVALVSLPLRVIDLGFFAAIFVAVISVLPDSRRRVEGFVRRITKQHAPRQQNRIELERLVDLDKLDPAVQQLSIRSLDSAGQTTVFAKLVEYFDSDERFKSLHLAFCPPFPEPPSVSAEVVEGPETQLHIGHCLSVGVRIDLQLHQTSTGRQRVVVEVFANSLNRVRSA